MDSAAQSSQVEAESLEFIDIRQGRRTVRLNDIIMIESSVDGHQHPELYYTLNPEVYDNDNDYAEERLDRSNQTIPVNSNPSAFIGEPDPNYVRFNDPYQKLCPLILPVCSRGSGTLSDNTNPTLSTLEFAQRYPRARFIEFDAGESLRVIILIHISKVDIYEEYGDIKYRTMIPEREHINSINPGPEGPNRNNALWIERFNELKRLYSQ